MSPGPFDEPLPGQASRPAGDALASKFDEADASGDRARRHRVDVARFGWARSKPKQIVQPSAAQPRGAPERDRRVDVWRRHDDAAFGERRADLPSKTKREIGRVQKEQGPR